MDDNANVSAVLLNGDDPSYFLFESDESISSVDVGNILSLIKKKILVQKCCLQASHVLFGLLFFYPNRMYIEEEEEGR